MTAPGRQRRANFQEKNITVLALTNIGRAVRRHQDGRTAKKIHLRTTLGRNIPISQEKVSGGVLIAS